MPTPARHAPLNTYRLQLHAGFTFADAAAQLDYLVELGITDLYLSPILESVPGSTHGYDVVDPTRISEERGGRAGFEALADAAHSRGLGVIVDIVPNHMAIPTPLWLNPALWSALRDGTASPYAAWFDIEPGAQLVLPNLPETNSAPDPASTAARPAEDRPGAEFASLDPATPELIAAGRLGFGELELPNKLPDANAASAADTTTATHAIPTQTGISPWLTEVRTAARMSDERRITEPPGPPSDGERVLLLDGQPYPLAPGTDQLPIPEALAAQHYALRRWQGSHTRLTHRRFFDIVTLIGVRQELPEVFDATHALLLELFHAGRIDGFRVDHPDGLADPQGYFERLHAATGGAWVVAEKILSGDELLPPAWPVAGTTGYEAAWRLDAVQLDPAAAAPLAALAQRTDEQPTRTWHEVADEAKRFVAGSSLAIDVDRLIRLVGRLAPTLPAEDARLCLVEFLIGMDRYRAYVRPRDTLTIDGRAGRDHRYPAGGNGLRPFDKLRAGQAQPASQRVDQRLAWVHADKAATAHTEPPADDFTGEAEAVLAAAADRARANLPERLHPTLAWLQQLAAGRSASDLDTLDQRTAAAEFVVRFQQVTGALVAKGVEDTAFYRWTQLLTLCDVGADPDHFGFLPPDPLGSRIAHRSQYTTIELTPPGDALGELHGWLGRVNAGWPATMSLGSSHDSKRSEDVRARIAVISEYPDEWAALVARLEPLAAELPPPARTILWQTLAGTWTDGPIPADRLAAFFIKAGREQKLWTSWLSPTREQEGLVAGAIPRLLADPKLLREFAAWFELTKESVRTNTLAAKLVQLTALGVADIYQGQETVRLSLTDPDNRRPVDFDALRQHLNEVDPGPGRGFLTHSGPGRQICRPTPPYGKSPWAADDHPTAPSLNEPGMALAKEKLLLTHLGLQLRTRHAEAFQDGSYLPLATTTRFAWAFARGGTPTAVTIATRLPRRREHAGGWQPDDRIDLPDGTWRNLLTGRDHATSFQLATDLAGWPCALLERIA